jgi:hypothetical protein
VRTVELRAKMSPMKHVDPYLAEPLTEPEAEVLRAYAQGDSELIGTVNAKLSARKAAWSKGIVSLKHRGFLQETERGMLVTPEGLAALLDGVPIEVMRTASLSVVT